MPARPLSLSQPRTRTTRTHAVRAGGGGAFAHKAPTTPHYSQLLPTKDINPTVCVGRQAHTIFVSRGAGDQAGLHFFFFFFSRPRSTAAAEPLTGRACKPVWTAVARAVAFQECDVGEGAY